MPRPRFPGFALAAALAVIGTLTATMPSAVAQAPDTTLIRLGTGPSDPSATLVYAVEAGLFKRAGINVEFSRQQSTATMAAAVIAGALDISQGSTFGAILILGKGIPLTLVSNLANYNSDRPDVALMVLANSPIKTPKDLEGKTISGVALTDLNSISTAMWLDQRGVNTTGLKFVEIPGSASLAAMEQGRVDATPVFDPYYSAMLASGKVRVIGYPYDSLGKHFSSSVLFARTPWAAEHGPLITRFQRVLVEAAAYTSAHESEVAPLHAQFAGLDPSQAGTHHPERMIPLNPADIQPVIDAAYKYKLIPKPFAAGDIICPCALRK